MMENEEMIKLLLDEKPKKADCMCKYFVLWVNKKCLKLEYRGKVGKGN